MGKELWGSNKLLTQPEAPWKVLLWESQQEWLGAWFGVRHMGQIQNASLLLPRQVTPLEEQPLLSEVGALNETLCKEQRLEPNQHEVTLNIFTVRYRICTTFYHFSRSGACS